MIETIIGFVIVLGVLGYIYYNLKKYIKNEIQEIRRAVQNGFIVKYC